MLGGSLVPTKTALLLNLTYSCVQQDVYVPALVLKNESSPAEDQDVVCARCIDQVTCLHSELYSPIGTPRPRHRTPQPHRIMPRSLADHVVAEDGGGADRISMRLSGERKSQLDWATEVVARARNAANRVRRDSDILGRSWNQIPLRKEV